MENVNWENEVSWIELQIGLKKYVEVMTYLSQISSEPSWDDIAYKIWRTRFNHFYRLRRNEAFQKHFYNILFNARKEKLTFLEVLIEIHDRTSRIEPSFASKLIATIDPNMPIWDSEVLNKLNVIAPKYGQSVDVRLKSSAICYAKISQWYSDAALSHLGAKMTDVFDKKVGITNLTRTKKIDLMLWQLNR